jgi:hypothetical protein
VQRRSLLKRSVELSAGAIAIGSTTAAPSQTLRLRRGKSDSIAAKEIVDRRSEVLKEAAETQSLEEPAVTRPELDEDEQLVAYNLTITDGVPVEYFGKVQRSTEAAGLSASRENDASSSIDPVQRIHEKAERKLRLAQQEARTKQMVEMSDNDWEDWTEKGYTHGDTQDDNGNNHGYLVKFKTNPESGDEYVTSSRSEMDPGTNSNDSYFLSQDVKHRHEWAEFDPVNAEMLDTEPPSDVGSSTTQMGLSLQSDEVVSVNLMNAVTRSNLQVDNHSSPNQHNYHEIFMEYGSTDIQSDFTKLNSASSAILDHGFDRRPPETVSVDLRARFFDPSRPWDVKHSKLNETFAYNIFGEL